MARGLHRRAHVLILALVVAISTSALPGCYRDNPCRDPTNDGMCYCPVGGSCQHSCNGSIPNCTLGCAQKNGECSVSCVDDCIALCTGARTCDVSCGDRCSVSCEWMKDRCTAQVGQSSHVNCEGAASCDVHCLGSCDVHCAAAKCRIRCDDPSECEIDCGGGAGPVSCPDGSRVCGRPC